MCTGGFVAGFGSCLHPSTRIFLLDLVTAYAVSEFHFKIKRIVYRMVFKLD